MNAKKESIRRIKLSNNVLTLIIEKQRDRATELIVKEILDHNSIYTIRDDENPEVWMYHEGIYISQGKSLIKIICRKILGTLYTSTLANMVIVKIETDTDIIANEFFKNRHIEEIAIKNGILNLITREVSNFTPNKIFFSKIPISYDKNAKCPIIDKHFSSVIKYKEDKPVLEEIFGFLLYKDYFIEKAIMFSGGGRNGKGKTTELMKKFIGVENCTNVSLQQLENNHFAVSELFNKMANLSPDLNNSALQNTGYFKSLTGRDLMSAPRKHLTNVEFVNYAKMIFCANNLPITYDTTSAFWNRWVLLEFPYQFLSQKEIDALSDKNKIWAKLAIPNQVKLITTDKELSGLLNLALDGLDRLRQKGDFSYNKNVEQVKIMWIRQSDNFTAFIMDCCKIDYDSIIIKKNLQLAYLAYCRLYKNKPVGTKNVKQSMAKFGVCDTQKMVDGNIEYVWEGIKLVD